MDVITLTKENLEKSISAVQFPIIRTVRWQLRKRGSPGS